MTEKDYTNKIVTIPNLLTLGRIIGSSLLVGFILVNGIVNPLMTVLATAALGLTDLADGFIAKHFSMQSKLGGVLDPIADKIFNWGIGIALMVKGIMPLWPLTIGIRDLAVWGFTTNHYLKTKEELKPTQPARAKMFLQSAGLVSTLAFGFGSEGLSLLAPIFMGGAIASVVPEVYCIKKKYFSKNTSDEIQDNPNSYIPKGVTDVDEFTEVKGMGEKNLSDETSPLYEDLSFQKGLEEEAVKVKKIGVKKT